MLEYKYECDTCSDNHLIKFETEEDAVEFLEVWQGELGFKVWRVGQVS
jgi:hypothetical protein